MAKSKTETEEALVPAPAPEHTEIGRPVVLHHGRLIPLPGTPLLACPTSLDLTSQRGRALAINLHNPPDYPIGGEGCARILATDWLVYPEERVDEQSGEVKQYVVTCFVDRHGRTLKTTSPYAAHRLAEMVALFSREEWARGIPVIVQERRSHREKRTYHDVRVDMGVGDGGA